MSRPPSGLRWTGAVAGPRTLRAEPRIVGALLLLAAVLVAAGMFSRAWGTSRGGPEMKYVAWEVRAGLFDFEACGDGECKVLSWEEMARRVRAEDFGIPASLEAFRGLGITGGFASLAMLLVAAGLAFSGRMGRTPLRVFVAALSFGLTTLGLFWVLLIDWESFSPGYSVLLSLAGMTTALVIAQRCIKLAGQSARPAPAPLGLLAPPRRPPPARPPRRLEPPNRLAFCPHCGTQAAYIPALQYHHCPQCQHYPDAAS